MIKYRNFLHWLIDNEPIINEKYVEKVIIIDDTFSFCANGHILNLIDKDRIIDHHVKLLLQISSTFNKLYREFNIINILK